jgi:uncharacterized protein (DUF433 family)
MITSNPNIRFGKYCINGTRISIDDIMSLYRNGMTIEEIQKEYPQLTKEQIIEAIKFRLSRFNNRGDKNRKN